MFTVTIPERTLNTGAKIPALGLGCWFGKKGSGENKECYDMVAEALKIGYRHVDTAFGYGNEEAVGRAIRESGIPREEIFVTTKLGGSFHFEDGVTEGFESSFKSLGLDYIDLYLMHWPQAETSNPKAYVPYGEFPTFNDTWKWMEKLVEDGRVKNLGVSNFSAKNLKVLLADCKIVPAVNQVESSPYLPQQRLTDLCNEKGIILTAYSPLGQPKPNTATSPILTDSLIKQLGEKYNKPAGTIVLSWIVQRPGWTCVPKSSNPGRLRSNFEIIELEESDFEAISKLHTEPGKIMSLCDFGQPDWHKKGKISGWTTEEIGWDVLD